jgi:hypothetical protein
MEEEFDPTADFLAREQAILGADAALFGNPIADSVKAEIPPPTSVPAETFQTDLFAAAPSTQTSDFFAAPPATQNDLFAPVPAQNDLFAPVTTSEAFATPSPITETVVVEEPKKSQALLYHAINQGMAGTI